MELRTAASPRDVKHYDTTRLREEFLIDDLFQVDEIKLYTVTSIVLLQVQQYL